MWSAYYLYQHSIYFVSTCPLNVQNIYMLNSEFFEELLGPYDNFQSL
jgi:hypothetical protein